MALQNKLKAFVRFDGSGRVIPSSLILQKSKPKVGNWKEINATQCCNDTPGTTTTTTTAGGSGFIFNVNLGYSEQSGCAGVPAWNLYAATPFLNNGTNLYYNPQLTQPYDGVYGSYIKYENVVYTSSGSTITNNGTACSSITTTTTSTTDPYFYYIANQYACPDCNTIVGTDVAIKSGTPVTVGSWIPRFIGGNLYYFNVTSTSGPNYMATAVDGGGASSTCGCPVPSTTTTTTTNGTGLYAISNAASAGADYQFCAFPVSQLNQQPNLHCSTPTLQVGSTLYASNNVNDLFTQPYVNNVDFEGAYVVSNGVITAFSPCN